MILSASYCIYHAAPTPDRIKVIYSASAPDRLKAPVAPKKEKKKKMKSGEPNVSSELQTRLTVPELGNEGFTDA